VLAVPKLACNARRIEIEFTDEVLTPQGGSVFVAGMAKRLGLPRMLSERIGLKRRRRGASDAQMLLSAIYSLAAGDGALRDVDRLGHDQARLEAVGLERLPGRGGWASIWPGLTRTRLTNWEPLPGRWRLEWRRRW
jgi:hypothetical protein